MNWSMVKQLVSKDWSLYRNALTAYILAGVGAAILFGSTNKMAFYVGMILTVSVFIVAGMHVIFLTVINERKEKTLPFVMSLPVSFTEYTLAKMIANLSTAGLAWLVILSTLILVILYQDNLPDGMIPYTVITVVELFVACVLVLSIALITESEGATIATMSLCNISASIFMFWLGGVPEIKAHLETELVVWNSAAVGILMTEFIIILLLIALTFYFQSKKREFL